MLDNATAEQQQQASNIDPNAEETAPQPETEEAMELEAAPPPSDPTKSAPDTSVAVEPDTAPAGARIEPRADKTPAEDDTLDAVPQLGDPRTDDVMDKLTSDARFFDDVIAPDGALADEDFTLTDEDVQQIRQDLEQRLDEALAEGADEQSAMDAWLQFESVTRTHSQELCEQLRLVLEASLASKLQGDYRTGKRLNIRKIIPYGFLPRVPICRGTASYFCLRDVSDICSLSAI